MNKPLIGINPYYYNYKNDWWLATKEDYIKAVYRAGGIPLTLNHLQYGDSISPLVERVDGVILTGGPDFHSNMYNAQNPELLGELMHPNRERFDRALYKETRRQGKSLLAICAGLQHINLICNGSLYEDIPTQLDNAVEHNGPGDDFVRHSLRLDPNSLLAAVMGESEPEVHSTHHQGIKKLGDGLRAVAWSSDGLIEAIEDIHQPNAFIAVQWHPELYPDSSANSRIFEWLIAAAEQRRL